MVNLILCGGSGTRLWPLSRQMMPKQFLKLFDGSSLFQKTVERNRELCNSFLVVANKEHYFLALDELEELGQEASFILEPFGKNTAAAIALAALKVKEDEILFVTPSDHLIKDTRNYQKAVERAKELAQEGYLVTFGITPTKPHTGYGYIKVSGEDVLGFFEKPDSKKAAEFLKEGNYLWNSGMFCFKAKTILEEFQRHRPKLLKEAKKAYENAKKSQNTIRIAPDDMQNMEDISIDYAIMEKSDKIKCVKSDFDWNDLGSFDELSQTIEGSKAYEIESQNNFVLSNRTVGLVGMEDIIVIDTKDALLILKKGKSQLVKELVKEIPDKNILKYHQKVHRPWGTYEVLVTDRGYKIKRIVVKPGKRLSLQKHFHRNEHWIVLSGTALVQVGQKEYLVGPNESTYIKSGEVHRLSNPGKLPVVLLEAQVGEYVGEDDIIRIEDDFQRGD